MKLASRVQQLIERIQAPPAWLRWIERSDPLVLEAYRTSQRSLVTRQLPIVAGACLAAAALKAFGVVAVGHPATGALYALGFAALLWPFSALRLSRVAWRASSSASALRSRLRLFAIATGALAALNSLFVAAIMALAVVAAVV